VLVPSLLAFVSFCLMSSSTYLINDIRDVEADRRHPTKRSRPIAAGELTPRAAVILAVLLALAALAVAVAVNVGLMGVVLTYAVCIPLGILKAIRHRTFVDNISSILIFVGYAIPGYALGSLLILFFSVRLEWFPMGGFVSYNFDELAPGEQALDLLKHSVLPLTCYMVGSFAMVTLLLKNHLMDNLAADYIRTAIAKGVSFRHSVTRHAVRNSLIPIATTFGQNVTLLVSGSFLVESIFDIDGFGLLGLSSILDRDYPVVMGIVLLASLLLLVGNILSDILVAMVDPRIRFQ